MIFEVRQNSTLNFESYIFPIEISTQVQNGFQMAPNSLRFRLDRLRKESFARGAAKPCGEWGGDALKSLSPSALAFRGKATRMAASLPKLAHSQK